MKTVKRTSQFKKDVKSQQRDDAPGRVGVGPEMLSPGGELYYTMIVETGKYVERSCQ